MKHGILLIIPIVVLFLTIAMQFVGLAVLRNPCHARFRVFLSGIICVEAMMAITLAAMIIFGARNG